MTEFEQMLRAMFSSIWDCDINHPIFCDTVGELMDTVTRAYEKCIPKSYVEVRKEETIDDLISRQAAIDIVTNNNHFHDITLSGDAYSRGYRDGYQIKESDILEDLTSLPSAQPEPKWIPCSERLPEEDGLYLVTTSKGQVQVHVFNHNGNSEEYWMRCNKAWMPLPEAYWEENEE